MSVRLFEEYLEEGIAKVQSPDFSRAKSLQKEAEESFKVLQKIVEKIGVEDSNANYLIKNVYDIIMELIRAKMLRDGYNSSGSGAHQAEVSYLRKLNFQDKDIEFVDKLRYFRNGIIYYGKSFDKDYAQKVINFLPIIYQKLKS